MKRKEDSRVIKTRASLRRALFELLSEKSYDNVTVNEICDKAGIRRATFYKHFADKNAFLFSVVHDLRSDFDRTVWGKDSPEHTKDYYIRYAEVMVHFLIHHNNIAQCVLKSSCGINIIGMLMHQNNIDTQSKLKLSIADGMQLNTSISSMSTMLIGGIAFMITDWFIDDKGQSAEQLIQDIKYMIGRLLD
ncbi:MAG: TetR/AcrR family transcriptional regulator [Clostridia bacterium]|nr:TetR/AcrR family transcriptional regulator [Clostridia bacterium]